LNRIQQLNVRVSECCQCQIWGNFGIAI
jgi:hypothetical protein